MALLQLHMLKRWHVAHKREHPVEYHAYDAVLTAWMMGWIGTPAALLLSDPWMLAASGLACMAPGFYVVLRERMHRAGKLRCDWLDAIPEPQR